MRLRRAATIAVIPASRSSPATIAGAASSAPVYARSPEPRTAEPPVPAPTMPPVPAPVPVPPSPATGSVSRVGAGVGRVRRVGARVDGRGERDRSRGGRSASRPRSRRGARRWSPHGSPEHQRRRDGERQRRRALFVRGVDDRRVDVPRGEHLVAGADRHRGGLVGCAAEDERRQLQGDVVTGLEAALGRGRDRDADRALVVGDGDRPGSPRSTRPGPRGRPCRCPAWRPHRRTR